MKLEGYLVKGSDALFISGCREAFQCYFKYDILLLIA